MRLTPLYSPGTGFSAVFLLLGLPLFCHAQDATALQTALSRCYVITSVTARVDCYDMLARSQQVNTAQLLAALSAAPSAAQITAPPSTSPVSPLPGTAATAPVSLMPASASPAPVAEFGQQAKVEIGDKRDAELTDTVTAVKRVEPTRLQITLTSGQVWRQSVGKNFLVREGETVHIRTSGWGKDYRLSVDGRSGYIQVSRQQ